MYPTSRPYRMLENALGPRSRAGFIAKLKHPVLHKQTKPYPALYPSERPIVPIVRPIKSGTSEDGI